MDQTPGFFQRHVGRVQRWRAAPVVSILRLHGVIAPGGGPLRQGSLNLPGLERAILKAFQPKRLAAVVLQINSPGGSPVQSALIARAIRRQAEKRQVPVYAFAEDVAASGGYWLATAADEIYADPSSILGSIGVIHAGFGLAGLLERLGVERRVHTAGERKAFLDPFRPEDAADVARLTELQGTIHTAFMDQVKARRGDRLNRRRYKEIFSGDVLLGEEAQRLGLIDGIADPGPFLREKFGEDVKVRHVGRRRPSLVSLFRGQSDLAIASAVETLEDRLMWNRYGL